MFEQGLLRIGDNYIAPVSGFFFCCIKEVKRKKADKLEAQIEDATSQIVPLSKPFMFDEHWECILFGKSGLPILPVQTRYLEVIGVDLSMLEEYTFMLNEKTLGIFVYDVDGLIGGVMPMAGDLNRRIDDTNQVTTN